jgi:hypothetical protein
VYVCGLCAASIALTRLLLYEVSSFAVLAECYVCAAIEHTLCVIWLAVNPLYFPVALGYYRIYRTPFLLLTLGGIDALDVLIQTNRFIKF